MHLPKIWHFIVDSSFNTLQYNRYTNCTLESYLVKDDLILLPSLMCLKMWKRTNRPFETDYENFVSGCLELCVCVCVYYIQQICSLQWIPRESRKTESERERRRKDTTISTEHVRLINQRVVEQNSYANLIKVALVECSEHNRESRTITHLGKIFCVCVCVFFLFSWICLPPIICSVCRFYRIIDNLTLCTDTWMNQINKQISATPVTITIAVTKAKRQALQSDVSGFFFHQLQIYNIILKYTWSYYLTSDRAWNRGFVAYDKKPSVRHGRMCIHEECTFLLLVAI